MKDKSNIVLYCIGGIVVIWFALIIAPYADGGILEIVKQVPQKLNTTPFKIEFCSNSAKSIFFLLLIYLVSIGLYITSIKKYRRGKEYGSAIWGVAKQINKKYMQFPKNQNKILTQNVNIGLNAKAHRRNLNILVCGR